MPEAVSRLLLAVLLAVGLGLVLMRLRFVPRDLALTVYAMSVAVLGIFAILGQQAALIGGGVVLLMFCVGVAIYGVLALAARWADR
jgi:hypothetical protein